MSSCSRKTSPATLSRLPAVCGAICGTGRWVGEGAAYQRVSRGGNDVIDVHHVNRLLPVEGAARGGVGSEAGAHTARAARLAKDPRDGEHRRAWRRQRRGGMRVQGEMRRGDCGTAAQAGGSERAAGVTGTCEPSPLLCRKASTAALAVGLSGVSSLTACPGLSIR
eukprot:scaffold242930_cov24-Tisochrysis_lutea.AAC.1